jgi:hypothetical protein
MLVSSPSSGEQTQLDLGEQASTECSDSTSTHASSGLQSAEDMHATTCACSSAAQIHVESSGQASTSCCESTSRHPSSGLQSDGDMQPTTCSSGSVTLNSSSGSSEYMAQTQIAPRQENSPGSAGRLSKMFRHWKPSSQSSDDVHAGAATSSSSTVWSVAQ